MSWCNLTFELRGGIPMHWSFSELHQLRFFLVGRCNLTMRSGWGGAGLSSYTFLEYFEAPFDFTTVATWSNLTAHSPDQNKACRRPLFPTLRSFCFFV